MATKKSTTTAKKTKVQKLNSKTTPTTKKAAKAANEPKTTKKLKEAAAIATTQKTILNRDLKYIYPKGCIDPQARKSHRQKIRKARERFLAKIATAKAKEKKELKSKFDEFMKLNYTTAAI